MTGRGRAGGALHVGRGIAGDVCARRCQGRRVVIVADASLESVARPLIDAVTRSATALRVLPIDAATVDVDVVDGVADALVRAAPEIVVAVGGGTVLDAAAIAAQALDSLAVLRYARERAATVPVVLLPPRTHTAAELIAIPTTVGTSAESNAVAVMRTSAGYRLLLGERLRPHHAILDADAYASLSIGAVRLGALEALLRVAGARTSVGAVPSAHARAVALARALVWAGSAAAPDASRIARLSAATQRTDVLRGRDPFAARHWYVANETAFLAGLAKMPATAAVIGSVWAALTAGDARWGDAAALRAFWDPLARDAQLPPAPATGMSELLDRWEIARAERPAHEVVAAIAATTRTTWGDPLPALRGLTVADLRDVLDRGRWAEPAAPDRSPAPSAPPSGEEVKRNDLALDHPAAAVRGARSAGSAQLGELLPGRPGGTRRRGHRRRPRDLSPAA